MRAKILCAPTLVAVSEFGSEIISCTLSQISQVSAAKHLNRLLRLRLVSCFYKTLVQCVSKKQTDFKCRGASNGTSRHVSQVLLPSPHNTGIQAPPHPFRSVKCDAV